MSSFSVSGQSEMLHALQRVQRDLRRAALDSLKTEAEEIGEEADISHVPIDTGALMLSKKIETRATTDSVEATISYGGPSAPYAEIVHERIAPGRKYLETPLMAAEKGMAARIAGRIKDDTA